RAAGPVLHYDRLVQRLRQLVGERSGEHVSPSARAQRDDDPDGPGGIVLGRRGRTHGERNDGDDRGDEKRWHDGPPFFVFIEDRPPVIAAQSPGTCGTIASIWLHAG